MHSGVIQHIIEDFKSLDCDLLLVENNDEFFFREDVLQCFKEAGFLIDSGNQLSQRISFELKPEDSFLILLSKNRVSCL